MEGGQNGFSTLKRTTTTATKRHTSLLCRIAGISVVFLLFARVKGLCFCRAKHVPIVPTHMFSTYFIMLSTPHVWLNTYHNCRSLSERKNEEKMKRRNRCLVACDLRSPMACPQTDGLSTSHNNDQRPRTPFMWCVDKCRADIVRRLQRNYRTAYVFFFFFLLFHTSTFQLVDKPWSQVSSFLPLGSCLPFFSRIGCSNPTGRRFFIEC